MRVPISKAIVAVATFSVLGLGSAWGQTQQPAQDQTQQAQPAEQPAQPAAGQAAPAQPAKTPQWKDRGEYDLVDSIKKEADPKKRLALLDEWTNKYPNTDFKETRLEMYMDAYRLLNDPAKMLDAAKKLLTEYPKNMSGEYWADMLIVSTNDTNPQDLDMAEKAAQNLLTAEKPAAATDEQWKATKQTMDVTAHRTLGWVAMQRKNWDAAEQQFTNELKLNPADAQASYWLGTVILTQKKPERQSEALYYFARAAAYDGPGALDPATRQKMQTYVQNAYTKYHGDLQGFQELLTQARTNPFPPGGFKILSSDEMKEKQAETLKQTNPALGFWLSYIKTPLTGPDAQTYFDQSLKATLVPPAEIPPFKAKVVKQEPALKPRKLVVAVENPEGDATLALPEGESLPGKVDPGHTIEFRGVASSFTPQPFMITFEVERKNITGWPAPAPAKKAPARRGAARRK